MKKRIKFYNRAKRIGKVITADSKYIFKRTSILLHSWILQSKQGAEIPDIIRKYERTPKKRVDKGVYESFPELKGKEYINFYEYSKMTYMQVIGNGKFEYFIGNRDCFYPLNLSENHRGIICPCFHGMDSPDVLLVEFSENWNDLTIYYIVGKGKGAAELLERWNNGETIQVKA